MAKTPLLEPLTLTPTFYSLSSRQIASLGSIGSDRTELIYLFLVRSTSSHPRTRTPPRPTPIVAPYHNSHLANRSGNSVTSPQREKAYAGIMTKGDDRSSRDTAEDEDDEEEDEIVFDDDEDEFGLPSLASMRRKKAAPLKPKAIDPGGGMGGLSSLGVGLASNNRQRANSSDIAEERGTSMYPVARKGEGKILRPQYKDILQGRDAHSSRRQ